MNKMMILLTQAVFSIYQSLYQPILAQAEEIYTNIKCFDFCNYRILSKLGTLCMILSGSKFIETCNGIF